MYICISLIHKTNKMTFTQKIEKALSEQGRTKAWLASKLGIQRTSLSAKLKNNTYSIADIFYISSLLGIN